MRVGHDRMQRKRFENIQCKMIDHGIIRDKKRRWSCKECGDKVLGSFCL